MFHSLFSIRPTADPINAFVEYKLGSFSNFSQGDTPSVISITGKNDGNNNSFMRAIRIILDAGDNVLGDGVRGVHATIRSSGAANCKALQGIGVALPGHTGQAIGIVGQGQGVATSGNVFAFQATVDGGGASGVTGGLIINAVTDTDEADHGIYHLVTGPRLFVQNSFIEYNAHGPADFLRLRDTTGATSLFRVVSTGQVLLVADVATGIQTVSVDIDDSAQSGFRALRVPN